MIKRLNLLARYLREKNRCCRFVIDRLYDYCWITSLGIWEFDPDRNLGRDDTAVSWSLVTAEDCRRWSESGADGFSKDMCDLLRSLVEQDSVVLAGRWNDGGEAVPDCYGACAFGRKPMTRFVDFQLHPDEGMIRTVYTRERSRGKGLATRVYSELCRIAGERGLARVFVDIDNANLPSIRAAEKAGARRIRGAAFILVRFFKRPWSVALGPLRERFVAGKE